MIINVLFQLDMLYIFLFLFLYRYHLFLHVIVLSYTGYYGVYDIVLFYQL